jgi:hypothetical protein
MSSAASTPRLNSFSATHSRTRGVCPGTRSRCRGAAVRDRTLERARWLVRSKPRVDYTSDYCAATREGSLSALMRKLRLAAAARAATSSGTPDGGQRPNPGQRHRSRAPRRTIRGRREIARVHLFRISTGCPLSRATRETQSRQGSAGNHDSTCRCRAELASGGNARRNARVSMPAATRTTWRNPARTASMTKSSKKRVRGPMVGFSSGTPGSLHSRMRRNPSKPASTAASGSPNTRSGRSVSRALPGGSQLRSHAYRGESHNTMMARDLTPVPRPHSVPIERHVALKTERGARGGIRTHDLRITSALLYH